VFYHVEVSATGRSLVQRSPTECGVSECVLEISTMRSPRPTKALEPWIKSLRMVCRNHFQSLLEFFFIFLKTTVLDERNTQSTVKIGFSFDSVYLLLT